MDTFQAKRLSKLYEMEIPAGCEQVFPLLCPLREYEWLPHWRCDIVYSATGGAEANCVFTTDFPGREGWTWVTTKYDPPRVVQYTVFKPESHVLNMEITLTPLGPGRSRVAWRHTLTGLGPEGNRYIADYTDEAHRGLMEGLEHSLIHFVTTGTRLDESETSTGETGA